MNLDVLPGKPMHILRQTRLLRAAVVGQNHQGLRFPKHRVREKRMCYTQCCVEYRDRTREVTIVAPPERRGFRNARIDHLVDTLLRKKISTRLNTLEVLRAYPLCNGVGEWYQPQITAKPLTTRTTPNVEIGKQIAFSASLCVLERMLGLPSTDKWPSPRIPKSLG